MNIKEDFVKFTNDSISFGGVYIKPSYFIDVNLLFEFFEYYNDTGINLLDDYSNLKAVESVCSQIGDKNYFLNKRHVDDYDEFIESINRIFESKLIISNDLEYFKSIKNKYINDYADYINGNVKKEYSARELALKYTSKKEIRNEVFSIHGKSCLCCGSSNNIHLDHIIPISKGGENSIENIQPLCRGCNISKHNKIIDYRKI